jgi:PilZ domain
MLAVTTEYNGIPADGAHLRHARMGIETAVLMSRRGDVWQTDLVDISATGVRLLRPTEWHGLAGDVWVLDMLFGDSVNVHVMAEVVRTTSQHIALAFARIPDDTQAKLWRLLGGYADSLEPWDEEIDPA